MTAVLWPDDDTVTPAHLDKYVSFVRTALVDAIDAAENAGPVRLAVRMNADRYSKLDTLDGDDTRALTRELVKARKKQGLRLVLGGADVRFRREGDSQPGVA